MGKDPVDLDQVRMWDFDPQKNRLVETPVKVQRLAPPHSCEGCEDPCEEYSPDEEGLGEEVPEGFDPTVLDGNEPWSSCPLCETPVEEGDITVSLTKWYKVYPRQDASYPIKGAFTHAHLSCAVRAIQEPTYSLDQCAKMVETCLDMWDEFNSFEKGAINDFYDMVSTGRTLTVRQQQFLARMSKFALDKAAEIALDPSKATPPYKPPLTEEQIPQYLRFIEPEWRYLKAHQRKRYDELRRLYLQQGGLTDAQQNSLKKLQKVASEIQADPKKREKPPRWLMAHEVIEEIFQRAEEVKLPSSEAWALERLQDIYSRRGDLVTKEQNNALRDIAVTVNQLLAEKQEKARSKRKKRRTKRA